MGTGTNHEQIYRCVHCGHPVRELYRDFKKSIIKISHCPKCHDVADKYIEYDSVIIFLDVLLLQRPVYRHILLNSKVTGYWRYLLVLWLCDALTKLMQRKAGDPSPRLQPDHVFYSALEWHFYQDYLLSVGESLIFFVVVVGLLAGKHFWRHRNLEHFDAEAVLRAVTVSSMGRLLVVPALIWGESYSALGVTLTQLFVASSTLQALRVVSQGVGVVQGGMVVIAGYVAQGMLLSLLKVILPACCSPPSFSLLTHFFPDPARLEGLWS